MGKLRFIFRLHRNLAQNMWRIICLIFRKHQYNRSERIRKMWYSAGHLGTGLFFLNTLTIMVSWACVWHSFTWTITQAPLVSEHHETLKSAGRQKPVIMTAEASLTAKALSDSVRQTSESNDETPVLLGEGAGHTSTCMVLYLASRGCLNETETMQLY